MPPNARPPALFVIPNHTKEAKCRACGASIYFVTSKRGRPMPLVPHSRSLLGDLLGISHFADCPGAESFRKERPA